MSKSADGTGSGLVILVEDDAAVRAVLALLLESEGWKVVEAADGKIALKLARMMSPDVIVTDLHMPIVSGIELATHIASAPDLPAVPVVAITSDDGSLREAAVRSGQFVRVLTKPLEPDVFLQTVSQATEPPPPTESADPPGAGEAATPSKFQSSHGCEDQSEGGPNP